MPSLFAPPCGECCSVERLSECLQPREASANTVDKCDTVDKCATAIDSCHGVDIGMSRRQHMTRGLARSSRTWALHALITTIVITCVLQHAIIHN